MALTSREDFIRRNSDEMFLLLRKLNQIYHSDDDKILRDIRRVSLFGNDMKDLEKNPIEAMNVFLPMIKSYAKVDRVFAEVVEILVSDGIVECMRKLEKVK